MNEIGERSPITVSSLFLSIWLAKARLIIFKYAIVAASRATRAFWAKKILFHGELYKLSSLIKFNLALELKRVSSVLFDRTLIAQHTGHCIP